MTYQELINLIAILTNNGATPLTIPTLGHRTTIRVTYSARPHPAINVKFGNKGREFIIIREILNAVVTRSNILPQGERWAAKQYTLPLWPECPHMIHSPYTAVILKYALEQTNANQAA